MTMTTATVRVTATTAAVEELADAAETYARFGIPHTLPHELIAAVHRLAAATGAPAEVARSSPRWLAGLPVSQLVIRLIKPDEIVEIAELRDRLLALGRTAKASAVTVALHRAVQRGDLVRVEAGQYRLPTDVDEVPMSSGDPQTESPSQASEERSPGRAVAEEAVQEDAMSRGG